MRYLSGAEIARLMGFPVSEPAAEIHDGKQEALLNGARGFSFPSHCTMKQQWKLLGNSLNVQVAAKVAQIGIQAILTDASR
jgi:tRNA (cytosine38-C5)-methyltransferase